MDSNVAEVVVEKLPSAALSNCETSLGAFTGNNQDMVAPIVSTSLPKLSTPHTPLHFLISTLGMLNTVVETQLYDIFVVMFRHFVVMWCDGKCHAMVGGTVVLFVSMSWRFWRKKRGTLLENRDITLCS